MGCLFGLVAVVQAILHYLGWLGMLLGVAALLFGNRPRGVEVLVGGFSLIVLKKLKIIAAFLPPLPRGASRGPL